VPGIINGLLLLDVNIHSCSYEARKEQLEIEGRQKMESVVMASTEASLAATLLTQPVWVVKTRMLLNVDPRIS
jgi:hypothetical protein